MGVAERKQNKGEQHRGWVRELVEFALDQDVSLEIDQQRAILKSHPNLALAHFNLGVLYYSQRRVGESINEFLTAIECDTGFGRAYRKLGEVYVNLGDYERAEWFARMASEFGDSTLLDAFRRHQAPGDYAGNRCDTDHNNIEQDGVV
jgi:tetratricopeptide (TPR) repeat protein